MKDTIRTQSVFRRGEREVRLPNVRRLSRQLHEDKEQEVRESTTTNHLLMQMGQFVDHDLTLAPEAGKIQQINSVSTVLFNFVISELFCCRPDLRDDIERCANIEILEDEQDEDKIYLENDNLDCLRFTRSDKADM